MTAQEATESESTVTLRRVETVLQVADEFGTGVGLHELSELLTVEAPATPESMERYLAKHAPTSTVSGGVAYRGPPSTRGEELDRRRARGQAYLASASYLVRSFLAPARGLVRCAAVTGSTAYGEPESGDDCDLLVVTRRGALWPFLAFTYLRLRLRRAALPAEAPSVWCFNFVLDERAAVHEFSVPQGFLFAREALTARVVEGESYYRGLVGSAGWLGTEAPRLYARWKQEGFPAAAPEAPAPSFVRVLNVLLFPIVGTYLQAICLLRNWRLRRAGRSGEAFRTVTRLGRLAYETEKFGRLTELFAPATVVAPEA
ncbi:MAG: hypothetical protein L3J87_05320 [Thermoplasmata archaeon]|nr:hypothetical protein [Thermoplasmata archaeon]